MNKEKLQTRVGSLVLVLAALGFAGFFVDRIGFKHLTMVQVFTEPSFFFLLPASIYFGIAFFWKGKGGQLMLALGIFGFSGPIIWANGSESYYGLAFLIIGTLLLHRFEFLQRGFRVKVISIIAWTLGWVVFSDSSHPGLSVINSFLTTLFIVVNLLMLYFLFEEEIRDLMAVNLQKDAVLAEKSAEIARLEPLSVLGERVAHVAHSFKNNLNQVSTALFLLEQVHDGARAAEKLREFSQSLNERIENILMVSRAGVDLEPELFDVARVLEGIRQVYLQERTFLDRVETVLTVEGPVLVHSVRWDFLLMVENILKNALEAITDRGIRGTIRIDLARGQLTIANNGGPIPLCGACTGDCLACPRYGKPGQTTKKGGTGHGLAQVFATCRTNGWGLRIRTHEDWTLFEIKLPIMEEAQTARLMN